MGIGGISNLDSLGAPQQAQNSPDPLSITETAAKAATELSEEIGSGAVNKKQLKTEEKAIKDTKQEAQETNLQKNRLTSAAVTEASASAQAQEEIDKKKRKERKKKEEQILAMGQLEGCFETAQLSDEEKEVVEEFFQNLNIFKKLKQKLGFEEERKERYTNLLKKKEAIEKLKKTPPQQ
ncbi:MAG: hypothetical protein VW378_04520 [bacterium]